MRLVAEYREEAARCRLMAARETFAKIRLSVLSVARQLEEAAYQREQLLKSGNPP